jgi:hypothetical protein
MTRLACLLLIALAVAASGCVTARAKGEPGGPALAAPDPPPHTVIPVQIAEEQPVEPVQDSPLRPSDENKQKPADKRPRLAEKPAEKPPDMAPAQPAAPPAPPLQTTTNVNEKAKAIGDRIRQAKGSLARINENALNPDQRLQFETAKRFLEQAEDALKVQNLLFAEELANKAATLAEALAKK